MLTPQKSRDFVRAVAHRFRLGTDPEGNAYLAVAGAEETYLSDSREALRALITEIKAGKADHLL